MKGLGAIAVVVACAGTLAGGCGGSRRAADAHSPGAEEAEGKGKEAGSARASKREAPDEPSEKGVPPEGGRPRVPAAPEALLAPGAVSEIQRALADRGHLGAHSEGELDAATTEALRAFQAEEGLAETGFPDRETLTRLGIDPPAAYGRPEE
jgi:peptidoglycan hydrolase-like protein with peptidoglycan-binding domain